MFFVIGSKKALCLTQGKYSVGLAITILVKGSETDVSSLGSNPSIDICQGMA